MNEAQQRPYDVRLVPAACAGWGVTAIGIVCGSAVVGTISLVCVGSAAALLITRGRHGHWLIGVVAVLVLCGCYSGAAGLRAWEFERSPVGAAAVERAWVSAAVVVREDPRPVRFAGPDTVSVEVELTRMDIRAERYELGGRLTVLAPAEGWSRLVPGQSVVVRGRLAAPDREDLTLATVRVTGAPLTVEPPGWAGRAASVVRGSLVTAAAASLPPDRAGVLPGLVVGDVTALSEDVEDAFRAAGLTHLTAVSGANFAIVLGAVLLFTRALGLGPRPSMLLCAAVLVVFVLVARPSPSVLRAAVMGGIGLLSLVTGRRRQAVPALCTAVLGLLAWWPELAVDFGFALSVTATAGLVVLAPVWVDWLRRHGWGRGSAEVTAVAAAAHAVTAPIVAGMAGTFSVVGILANILVAPVIAPITVVGASAAVIAPWASGPASLILTLASAPLWWLVSVAQWCARVPTASMTVPDGPLGFSLVVFATAALLICLRSRLLRWLVGVAATVTVLRWVIAVLG